MKKVIVLILIMILLTTITCSANSYKDQYKDYAEKLKEIGVFKGTSSGFELDREPTRIEAAVMFVRLLGAEQEALEKKYEHPFTDVPAWASDYVGYLYHEKLSNGVDSTTFGASNNIQAKSYLTFILRALGYDDSEGEFSWGESLEFAKNKEIINDEDFNELNTKTFLRDHVAKVSYKALQAKLKDMEKTLIGKLVEDGAITNSKATEIRLIGNNDSVDDLMKPRKLTDEEIKELRVLAEGDIHNKPKYWLVDDGRYGEVIKEINEVFDTDILKLKDNAIFLSDDKLYFKYGIVAFGKIGKLRVKFPDGSVKQQVVAVILGCDLHTEKYERVNDDVIEYGEVQTIKEVDQ